MKTLIKLIMLVVFLTGCDGLQTEHQPVNKEQNIRYELQLDKDQHDPRLIPCDPTKCPICRNGVKKPKPPRKDGPR